VFGNVAKDVAKFDEGLVVGQELRMLPILGDAESVETVLSEVDDVAKEHLRLGTMPN